MLHELVDELADETFAFGWRVGTRWVLGPGPGAVNGLGYVADLSQRAMVSTIDAHNRDLKSIFKVRRAAEARGRKGCGGWLFLNCGRSDLL
jgi:hypothetical protein